MSVISEQEMKELIKAERQAYFKAWRADNKDKVKKHNENYWERRVKQKLEAGELNGN